MKADFFPKLAGARGIRHDLTVRFGGPCMLDSGMLPNWVVSQLGFPKKNI